MGGFLSGSSTGRSALRCANNGTAAQLQRRKDRQISQCNAAQELLGSLSKLKNRGALTEFVDS